MSLPWPSFWQDVPEPDRAPLRTALVELLTRGAILGDEGSGRDRYRLIRDYHRDRLEEYLAPLGLRLRVHEEPYLIIQAVPVPDECELLAKFTLPETIFALVLWRMYDETFTVTRTQAVILTAGAVWAKWRVFFPSIDPPTDHATKEVLRKLKRRRFVRYAETGEPIAKEDTSFEVLRTLVSAIDFESIAEWQAAGGALEGQADQENEPPPNQV